MKIYIDDVYCVIELPGDLFDFVTEHLISHSDETVKYLCANDTECNYLAETLCLDDSYLHYGEIDYYKLILKDDVNN